MRLPHSQSGLSKLLLLLILGMAAFVLLCAFRIIPAYTDDYYIQAALKSLEDDAATINDLTDREIRRKISNFYMVNNVRNHSAKDVEIERYDDGVLVSVNYEVQIPLIYNIDVLITFENEWDSATPHKCCKPSSE